MMYSYEIETQCISDLLLAVQNELEFPITQIVKENGTLLFEFSRELTSGEETQLTNLVNTWECPIDDTSSDEVGQTLVWDGTKFVLSTMASEFLIPAIFAYNSSASNRWLDNTYDGVSSNESPFVVPFDGIIKAVTYSNENFYADTRIEIHRTSKFDEPDRDSEVIHTETLYNIRTAVYAANVSVSSGDKIAVFLTDIGSSPKGPIVTLYISSANTTVVDIEDDFRDDFESNDDDDDDDD